MHRRALLALLASSAAGCLEASTSTTEQSPSPSTNGTATLTATGETTLAVDDVTVELTAPRVRPSAVAVVTSSTHLGVLDAPRTQYFIVDAQSAGATMSEAGLRLDVDGTTIAETFQWVARAESESKGTVAFAVPHGQYSRATLVLDRDEGVDRWRLPTQIIRRLSTPPVFELTSFAVPDSVVVGNRFQASFTVENTGERNARFPTEFGGGQLSDTGEVSIHVAAGESTTYDGTIDPYYDNRPESIPVVLDWGIDRRVEEVPVEYSSSPTPTRESTTPTPRTSSVDRNPPPDGESNSTPAERSPTETRY